MSYFESFTPVRTDAGEPVFDINGREWTGHWWDRDPASAMPRELRCVREGLEVSIKEDSAGFYAKLTYRPFEMSAIEKGERFATFDEAERFGLEAEFVVLEAAGVKWYAVIDKFDYTKWEAVLNDGDKGSISRFAKQQEFSVERDVWAGNTRLTLSRSGYDLRYRDGGTDGRITTFEDAAVACVNLFESVVQERGGDDYRQGVADGRQALKVEMLSMLGQASSLGGVRSTKVSA